MIILSSPNRNRKQLVAYGNGLLYNWYAVSQATFAPVGWHVPTDAEFTTLSTFLGGTSVAGGKMKSTRTGVSPGWTSPNTGADNSSGFGAMGGGFRSDSDGAFSLILTNALFWTSINVDSLNATFFYLQNTNDDLIYSNYRKKRGMSVRLIKDDSTWYPGMIVTDKDGNKYATVKIGNQVWLASNWKCTKYNDGTSIPNVTVNATWAALTTGAYCRYDNAAISEYTELF